MQELEVIHKRVFFSIAIASFNALNDLIGCIESIKKQNFTDYEIIISDGGSADGTLEYIASGAINNLSWYKSSPDEGIYDALNIALDHITGKWVLVLGADDRLADSSSLARAHSLLKHLDGSIGIAYSNLFISYNNRIILKKYPEFYEFEKKYNGGAFIHHQSAFIASDAIFLAGKFSSQFKIHSDYDLMLKILKISLAKKINDAFVVYSSRGFSSKLHNFLLSFKEIYLIRKSHGHFAMPPRLLKTFAGALIRNLFSFFNR